LNPPDLLPFTGDWPTYEAMLYQLFFDELARGGLEFRGWQVQCRRRPEHAGKWAAFWHLVQEGPIEEQRTPDMRRCERLRWIRWVIEQAQAHSAIDEWQNTRQGERNTLLWFNEEYLVILAERSGYWLLKSAYCTDRSGRIAQLRKERDATRS
jgi:hypothetical protein